MPANQFDPKVIIALDFANSEQADALINTLSPSECRLKIGKEMFTHFGPAWVKTVVAKGFDVFLDLKFHDIPNTVAKACIGAAELGVWMVNVHASGGKPMMQAAMQALKSYGDKRPLLTAVTVLTSMDQEQFNDVVGNREIAEQVKRLALLTQDSGLDGVVCSAQEALMLREVVAPDFLLVTPGIRPEGFEQGDQKRVVTPHQAIKDGVSYLVVGRPITQAQDPAAVLKQINQSL